MARPRRIFNGKYDYAGALAEYEKVLQVSRTDATLYGLALFKSAWCYWRLGQQRRGREALRRRLRGHRHDAGGKNVERRAAKAARRAPGRGAQVPRRGLHRGREEHRAGHLQLPHEDRRRTLRGKIVRALAEQFYDQAHYERGIEAYELLLKLEPTSPRRRATGCSQIAQGYASARGLAAPRRRPTTARSTGYTAGRRRGRARRRDPANVAATTAADREAAARGRDSASTRKAQKDKTSRAEFEGAAGALRRLPRRSSARSRRRTRSSSTSARSTSTASSKHTDAATHYMARRAAMPDEPTRRSRWRRCATTRSTTRSPRSSACASPSSRRARAASSGGQRPRPTRSSPRRSTSTRSSIRTIPQLPELFFRQGKLYYDYGVYDSAVKIWGMLLEKFPNSEFARDAGELILDSFNRAKNYENIETWARRLKTRAGVRRRPSSRAKLDTLIVQVGVQAGRAEGRGGRSRRRGGGVPARREGVPEGPARRAGVRERRASRRSTAGDIDDAARRRRTLDHGQGLPRQARVADRRVDRRDARSRRWASSPTPPTSTKRSPRSPTASTRTTRSTSTPRTPRTTRSSCASATGEHDKAIADGNKFLAAYATARRGRRGRLPDGQGAPERGPQEGRGRALPALPRAREEPRPPRAGLRAARAGADQETATTKGADDALDDAVDARQAAQGASSAPTASTPPRTRATCRASASSRSSSRSRSRAT